MRIQLRDDTDDASRNEQRDRQNGQKRGENSVPFLHVTSSVGKIRV